MPESAKDRLRVWRRHWPEYAIEAALLGSFMVSACLFSVVLFYPGWPAAHFFPDPFARRVLMGLAMGSTAIGLNYSAWGKQSGAHYNPAVTLTFTRLGKVAPTDAAAYVAAQFLGAVIGVMLARFALEAMLADSQVHFAVTRPGPRGVALAFLAEVVISFILMTVVLIATNHQKYARYTGVFAGLLVATFITVEAPLSGMSMNPARTIGSAFWAGDWTDLWIYFTAPPLGMLLAAELYLRRRGPQGIFCAKLHHQNEKRCIFCEFHGRRNERREREEKCVSGENTPMLPAMVSTAEHAQEKSLGATVPVEETNPCVHRDDVGL
jgi:aquaporin Z